MVLCFDCILHQSNDSSIMYYIKWIPGFHCITKVFCTFVGSISFLSGEREKDKPDL